MAPHIKSQSADWRQRLGGGNAGHQQYTACTVATLLISEIALTTALNTCTPFLHHPFEAIGMTSSLNRKFVKYPVQAEGNWYSLKSTVPYILMRTNILQDSLYMLKSRMSKDCVVEMLICRTGRRHDVHRIDKYHRETSAVIDSLV